MKLVLLFLTLTAIAASNGYADVDSETDAGIGGTPSPQSQDRLIQRAYKTQDPAILQYVEAQYQTVGPEGLNESRFRGNLTEKIFQFQDRKNLAAPDTEGGHCLWCDRQSQSQGSSGMGSIGPLLTALASMIMGGGNSGYDSSMMNFGNNQSMNGMPSMYPLNQGYSQNSQGYGLNMNLSSLSNPYSSYSSQSPFTYNTGAYTAGYQPNLNIPNYSAYSGANSYNNSNYFSNNTRLPYWYKAPR